MKNNLLFDFTIDKTNNTITVNRAFEAELPLVWDAFTKEEILDQWWGPEPWKSKTKIMDFTVGGRRLYAMVGPEGDEHWSLQEFTAIHPISHLRMLCSFTDKDGNTNPDLNKSDWNLSFIDQKDRTTVNIVIHYQNVAAMEQMIAMGFQGGFTMGLNQLEKLLLSGK